MSDEMGWKILRELVSTPNGQIRIAGTLMCIGPAVYIFGEMGSEKLIEMVLPFAYTLMYIGTGLICLSSVMAVIAAVMGARDRRSRTRPHIPVSSVSLKFAGTITESIHVSNLGDLPSLPEDKALNKNELLQTVNRLRGREACHDPSTVYLKDMHVVPRHGGGQLTKIKGER